MFCRALEPRQQQHAEHSIHVLDMPGLRFLGLDAPHVMQRFSDICHNYAQERLQSVFHHSQFEKEIDAYLSVSRLLLPFSRGCRL